MGHSSESLYSAWWQRMFTGLAGAALILVSMSADAFDIVKLEAHEFTLDYKNSVYRINQAYFDQNHRVQWNGEPVDRGATLFCGPVGGSDASPSDFQSRRVTRLLKPRVDEFVCTTKVRAGMVRTETTLFGLDSQGKVRWQRQLVFSSGNHSIQQWLIGTSPTALVLSSLEVWSPDDGRVLYSTPVRYVQEKRGRRPIPLYEFHYAAAFSLKQKAFYVYTPYKNKNLAPGISRVTPESGAVDLVWPLVRNRRGHVNIEHMLVDASGRWLLLAQRQEQRGPSWVQFTVLDTVQGKQVFQEKFGRSCVCQQPRIVFGQEGNIAFVYQDLTKGKHIAIHYKVRSWS